MEESTATSAEKRAAYYENIIIGCIECIIEYGHWTDPLSRKLAEKLECLDRLPEQVEPVPGT